MEGVSGKTTPSKQSLGTPSKKEEKDKDSSNADPDLAKENSKKCLEVVKNGAKHRHRPDENVVGKFTTSKVKAKSVENKLDKLDATNIKENGATPNLSRSSKSIFAGHNFCMDPEQMGIRLNLMSNKNDMDPEKTFLGFCLTRQNPQARLVTLNKLLNLMSCLDSTEVSPVKSPKVPFPVHEVSILEKTHKTVSKYLGYLKASVLGDKILNDKDLAALTGTMVKIGFISTLVTKMPLLGFEDRKTASLIWCNLLRRPAAERKIVAYIESNTKVLLCLLDGYHNQSLALTTGTMLRECFRYESLAKAILYSEYFYEIFEFLNHTTFDVSTDAFLTLQTLLMEHIMLTERFLLQHFSRFFKYFDQLIVCENYVTQLSSLKLLGNVLLNRHLYEVMQHFIQDSSKLKRIILLMSSASPIIRTEGFHVFKVFIANPTPNPKVMAILVNNNEKLLRLMSTVQGGDCGDSFSEEMAFVVKRLKEIGKKESGPGSTSGSISDENSNSIEEIY